MSLLSIIPRTFRRKALTVTSTIFLRALLNFLGLTLLIPVLMLILDPTSIHTNPYLAAAYIGGDFSSEHTFTLLVCLAIVVIIVGKCLLNLLLYRVERNYIYGLYSYMSRHLYIAYHNRGLSFIKASNSAVLARNVNVVCLTFVTGILKPIATIASESLLFLLLFLALTLYNPGGALLSAALFLPAVALYYGLVRNKLNRYGEIENRAQRQKARTVIESFRGYSDIEINNAFPLMLNTFQRAMNEVVATRAKESTIALLPSAFTEIGVAVGMVILVVSSLGGQGQQAQLFFGIFAVAALRLMPSVRNVMAAWTSIKFNRYTIDVLRDADFEHINTDLDENTFRLPFTHEICIENLAFRFEDATQDTLRNLSLTIRKGERIGIRGMSGSGKTTLFNLLLGFYTPTAGRILLDGEPLTRTNRRAWQNTVGYVSQNVFITDGTFLENIALGCTADLIDRKRAIQALHTAQLSEFISTLSTGVDTRIGECGCRLSGGQRQRIGIARALYKQADVLFFDEATSSLDTETEGGINRAIEQLSHDNKSLTIIIIAHRDSSLNYCDRIITL